MVAGTGIAARVAVLLATPGYRPIHDDAAYLRHAASLLTSGRYPGHLVAAVGWQPSTYRPPGWPMALFALWRMVAPSVLAGRLLLIVLGAGMCVCAAAVAGHLWGRREALAAGLLLAVNPLLLSVGASLLSETLFCVLVLGAVALALGGRGNPSWRRLVAIGVLVGAAALTRTNGLVLIPLIAWLAVSGLARRPAVFRGVTVAAMAVLMIAPWTIRNAVVAHRFIPVSSEAGNTLAGAYNSASMARDGQWLEPRRVGAYKEIYRHYGASSALDPALTTAVGHWILRHPSYPLEVLANNTGRLLGATGPAWAAFSLHTVSLGGRAGTIVWLATLALSVLGIAGLFFAKRRLPAPLLIVLLALLAPTALVTGELRFAAPLQAMLVVSASAAIIRLIDLRRGVRDLPLVLQARLLTLRVRRHARRGDAELPGDVLDDLARNVTEISKERAHETNGRQLHRAKPSRL